MTPEALKSLYRRQLGEFEPITVRRYIGAGPNRPHRNVQVDARVFGYQPHELIGGIVQGDRRVILLADDLVAAQWPLAANTSRLIVESDKIIVRGKECDIIKADDSTRRVNGVLIAFEIQARG